MSAPVNLDPSPKTSADGDYLYVPLQLVPSLPRVTPDDFREIGIDGFCSYWHYKPLAERVCALVKPRAIFEIGFFLGSSAYCWLSSCDAKVVSCDPIIDAANDRERVFRVVEGLNRRFNHRLTFIPKPSSMLGPNIRGMRFDLAFIDGLHTEEGVAHDIQLCADLKIPYILLDDFANTVLVAYSSRFLNVYEPVQGYSLENGPTTNEIDCMLCRLKT